MRPLLWFVGLCTAGAVICALLLGFSLIMIAPNLPSLEALTDYRPKIPLRIYTADNALIGEFGQERRDFVAANDMPKMMKLALLSVEDSRFYEHGGVDFKGVLRAIVTDLTSGHTQGASTITMQLARDFYLTKEKLAMRKLTEVMLAYKIEDTLNKEQILELYMNQVYLGQRAYGFGAASRIYFGKKVQDLSIAQMAMLAGLPQRPADVNPISNFKRAKARQLVILKRMLDLNVINQQQFEQASVEDLAIRKAGVSSNNHAQYVAEMVRLAMYEQYKDDIYTNGMAVYTTILKSEQDAAYAALRKQVLTYDQRHGYRGPELQLDLPADDKAQQEMIDEAFSQRPKIEDMPLAVVTKVSAKSVQLESQSGEEIEISGEYLRFVAAALSNRANATLKIRKGSILRIMQDAKGRWMITQLPQVAAGFAAIDAATGGMRALVGGFDFNLSKFNHATQAWRQPGSSMKPFIYSAAVAKGFSPGTIINDNPLTISAAETGSKEWSPQNDDNEYSDAISMRNALAKSKNVVSVRILQAIGTDYAQQFLQHFGFDPDKHPRNLTMTLGTGSASVQQMASAYAVFANGGYKVSPYLISKVLDARGKLLFAAQPIAQDESQRVLDAKNAFLMHQMLHQVVISGTGAAATQKLGRQDLAGKTGTTSDALDGWFAGYAQNTVAVAWMGYDDPKSLGGREFGATLALPIWIDYMRVAMAGKPQTERHVPAGVVNVDGDWVIEDFLDNGRVRTLGLGSSATNDGAPNPDAVIPTNPNNSLRPAVPANPTISPRPALPTNPPNPPSPPRQIIFPSDRREL